MRVEIKRIQKALGITTIFVTHDQEECFSISDKVAVMNKGVIEQYDAPEVIYKKPKTEFIARFIGFHNFLNLTRVEGCTYKTPGGQTFTVAEPSELTACKGTIRPDDITVAAPDQTENILKGMVGIRTFLGKSYQYEIETEAGKLTVNMDPDQVYDEGQGIRLYLPQNKLVLVANEEN